MVKPISKERRHGKPELEFLDVMENTPSVQPPAGAFR